MATRQIRDWKRLQPISLRHALELSKDHARVKLNRSVERIANEMGLADHWWLYKIFQSGRLPANLIRPFETACGINYVTRWIASSGGMLTIEIPSGRKLKDVDLVTLHTGFGTAVQMLTDLYAGKSDTASTIAALTAHMESIAWHRANVAQYSTPELDFSDGDGAGGT
jgi:hypothetical protein